MLNARESRFLYQRNLLTSYRSTLISFTLNIPGAEKQNENIKKVHTAGMALLYSLFSSEIIFMDTRHQPTGSEGFICLYQEAQAVKQKTTELENTFRLGRLFDIDVFTPEGESVGRTEIGLSPRKCFLCDEEAKLCIKKHRHTQDELLKTVYTMIEVWEQLECHI
jgi:holo-ACP synthase